MPTLTEKSYILGIWFSEDRNSSYNWMCTIYKDDGHWKGEARFRYAKDDKIFDNEDKKSWTHFTIDKSQTEKQIIQKIGELQEALKIGYLLTDRLIVQGDLHKFLELAKTKPWMNMKMVNKKDEI